MERNEFEKEVQRIRPRLHQQALRYLQNADDAEDVTQDVLLKLWSIRTTLDEYRSVEALTMVMAKNLCINRLRTAPYSQTDIEEIEKTILTDTPEEQFIAKEEYERLMGVMGQLPDIQQATLRMKHVDGLEIEEIARITGTKEVTVRTNLSRARRKIMESFIK